MARYRRALVALLGLVAAALVVTAVVHSAPPTTAAGMGSAALIPADERQPAPELTGIQGWLNSQPLTLASLHGSVVLVDFWTFSCVNCVRTFAHLRHLEQTYARDGLVVIGVHSPEFDFEKEAANVAAAVRRLGVVWPVALDPQLATWNAFGNQYWPAEYLIDRSGRIAYIHDGEGDYDTTESAIASLLSVRAHPLPAGTTPDSAGETPELYAGSDRGQLAGGEQYGPQGNATWHPDPGKPQQQDAIQVVGSWADLGQYLESRGPGHVRLDFSAHDLYLVVGAGSGYSTVTLSVTLDGAAVPAAMRGADLGAGGVSVSSQRLYHVLTGLGGGRHLIDIAVPAGLQLYTFTFG